VTPETTDKPDVEKDVNELIDNCDPMDETIRSLMIQKVDSKTSNQERRMTTTVKQVEEE